MAVTSGVLAARIGGTAGTPYRYTAPQERQLQQVKWLGTTGSTARGGKRPGLGWEVTFSSSPAERWLLAAGSGVVADSTGILYEVSTTGTLTENFGTRPGAGQSRIDLLILEVLDAEIYSGETSSYQPQVRLVSGTAATTGSQVAPTITTHNYMLLATITTTSSGNPSIVQAIPRTVTSGGIVPVTNAADLATLVPYNGLIAFQEDTGVYQARVGGAWLPIPAGAQAAAGHIVAPAFGAAAQTINSSVAGALGSVTIPTLTRGATLYVQLFGAPSAAGLNGIFAFTTANDTRIMTTSSSFYVPSFPSSGNGTMQSFEFPVTAGAAQSAVPFTFTPLGASLTTARMLTWVA